MPTDPEAAVQRFYRGLAGLGSREWVSIVTAFPIGEYELASEAGRAAVEQFAEAPTDPAALVALKDVQWEAEQVVIDSIPTMEAIRADMRRGATPGAGELSEEHYQYLKQEAVRRVVRAASGLALAGSLSPAALSGLYRPFEGFIPLSEVLLGAPTAFENIAREPSAPPMEDVAGRARPGRLPDADALLAREQQAWAERKRATIAWSVIYGAILLVGFWIGWWASPIFWAIAAFLGLGVAYGLVTTLSLAKRRRAEARLAAELPIDAGFLVEASPGATCVNCGAPAIYALPSDVAVNYCRADARRFVRLALLAARD